MNARDYRDIIGGLLLTIAGLWIGIYAAGAYRVGTLTHMGPGMFPASLGFMMAGMGVLIGVPALFRPGALPPLYWRPLTFIVLAVVVFALTVTHFGMVPAVVLMTIVSTFSEKKLTAIGTIMLSAVLATLAYAIFPLALGILVAPFRWPF